MSTACGHLSPLFILDRLRFAEQQIMGHLATAGPEIERRLREWLTAHDGLLFLREPADAIEPYGLHVVPRRVGSPSLQGTGPDSSGKWIERSG